MTGSGVIAAAMPAAKSIKRERKRNASTWESVRGTRRARQAGARARQVGGAAGSGDDDSQPALLGARRVLVQPLGQTNARRKRKPVRAKTVHWSAQ
eukprot:5182345-Pleurochrysis_carterae.AAC.3